MISGKVPPQSLLLLHVLWRGGAAHISSHVLGHHASSLVLRVLLRLPLS